VPFWGAQNCLVDVRRVGMTSGLAILLTGRKPNQDRFTHRDAFRGVSARTCSSRCTSLAQERYTLST